MKNIIIILIFSAPLFSYSQEYEKNRDYFSYEDTVLAQSSKNDITPLEKIFYKPKINFIVREAIDNLDPEDQGAIIGVVRDEGENSYLVRAGMKMFGKFPAEFKLGELGWEWYAGAQIDKNTSETPSDARLFIAGINGVKYIYPNEYKVQPSDPFRISLGSSFSVKVADNKVEERTSTGLIYQGIINIEKILISGGKRYGYESSHWVYPVFGIYVDHISRAPSDQSKGTATGGYLGINATYNPGHFLPINFNASYLRARDFHIDDNEKRSSKIFTMGIDYLLFDPTKPGRLQPSISLDRRVGSNYMTGLSKTNETVLTFRLKFDL